MKASQRHELEKDRMDTLQASGVSTSTYHGDSLLDGEQSSEDNDDYDENGEDWNVALDEDDAEGDAPATNSRSRSLIFIFDCETTGLSIYQEHMVELAAEVLVPSGVTISRTEFSSLCYTARRIPKQGYRHTVVLTLLDTLSQLSFRLVWYL